MVIITATEVDDPQEVAWAEEASANGALVVGIGPQRIHPDASTRRGRLAAACDVWMYNQCTDPTGVFSIGGEHMCPATGMVRHQPSATPLMTSCDLRLRLGPKAAALVYRWTIFFCKCCSRKRWTRCASAATCPTS